MKPLKLTISAFKSYGKKIEIDFEKLGNDGIYLITGKTGAGKTTIFDAMSFALFGNLNGEYENLNNLRSKYSNENDETFVEFLFSHKNKKYFIKRSPSYERKSKKSKSKTAKQDAKVEFFLPDGKIYTKKNEVKEKIKDILGVDETQFSKICMIAQGAFSKFLFAKTQEKENIFRNIFKTTKYGILEEKIKEKFKKSESDNNFLMRELENFKSKIECDSNFELKFLDKNEKNKDFLGFLTKLISLQENQNEKFDKEIKKLESEKNTISKNLEKAQNNLQKKEKLEKLENEKKDEKIKFDIFEKKMKNHFLKNEEIDKLNGKKEIISKDLKKYSELKNLKVEKNEKQKLFLESEKEKEHLQKNFENEIKNLKNLQNRMKNLENCGQNLIKSENEIEKMKNKMEKFEEIKNLFEEFEKKKENLKNFEEKVLEIEKIGDEIFDKIKKNNENLKEKEIKIKKFEKIEKNLSEFLLKKNKISLDLKNLENLKKLNLETEKIYEEYEIEIKKYEKSNIDFEKQDKYSKNLRKIYNNNLAGILAKNLIENEPCPVCGSKTHPKPNIISEIENISLKKVEKEEKISQELFEKTNKLSLNCRQILQKFEILKDNFSKNLKENFKNINNFSNFSKESELNFFQKEKEIKSWIDEKSLELESEFEKIEKLIENEEKKKIEKENCENEIEALKEEVKKLELKSKKNQEEKIIINSQKIRENAKFENIFLEIVKKFEKDFENKKLNFIKDRDKLSIDFVEFENEKNKILEKEKNLFEDKQNLEKEIEILKENKKEFENLKNEKIPEKEEEIETLRKRIAKSEQNSIILDFEIKNFEKNIDNLKKSLEFENEEKVLEKIEELEKQILEIRGEIEKENRDFNDSKNKLFLLKNQILELKNEINKTEKFDILALSKNLEEIKNELKTQNEIFQKNSAKILVNKKIFFEYKNKINSVNLVEKENSLLKNLLDTIQGNLSGKDKIKFETYIQTRYFDRILDRANKRFLVMLNGKFELKRSKNSDGKAKIGLNLEIFDHHNGTRREVTTLSGGESFLASLSLALGFSDEIQAMSGGIELNTLFIDEGFGTLDEETLDTALKALKSLSTKGKIIGIISHVNELKSEIDKQIVVTKNREGMSSVEIKIF